VDVDEQREWKPRSHRRTLVVFNCLALSPPPLRISMNWVDWLSHTQIIHNTLRIHNGKMSEDWSFFGLFFSVLPLVVNCAKIMLPYLLWKAFHTFRWQITLSINNKKIYLVMKCFLCFLGHVLNYLDNHTTCMASHRELYEFLLVICLHWLPFIFNYRAL